MAVGNTLLAEVYAERADVRVRLYLINGRTYRLRFGSGIGWAPTVWHDYNKALDRLLACASYGPEDIKTCQRICTPNP